MARLLDELSSSTDCLARLVLAEDGALRLSRVIVIERGEGGCILKPGEIATVRPERSPLTPSLPLLVTLDDLTTAGAEAYMPFLQWLLQHGDPNYLFGTGCAQADKWVRMWVSRHVVASCCSLLSYPQTA